METSNRDRHEVEISEMNILCGFATHNRKITKDELLYAKKTSIPPAPAFKKLCNSYKVSLKIP